MAMDTIIRGTTPTISFSFASVLPSELTTAILTIKSGDSIVVEKDLNTATIESKKLLWTLSQSEALTASGKAEIMLNWVTSGGTRGSSGKTEVYFEPNHIDEVIE